MGQHARREDVLLVERDRCYEKQRPEQAEAEDLAAQRADDPERRRGLLPTAGEEEGNEEY